MTGARFHPAATYKRLKAASRRLVHECGTEEEASAVTRVSRSKIGHYGNINMAETFMPLDVVIDLESSVGNPILTREMARLQGHVLIELPHVMDESEWHRSIGKLARGAGAVIAGISEALADDGDVSAEEIIELEILKQIDDSLQLMSAMRRACLEVMAGRGPARSGEGRADGES